MQVRGTLTSPAAPRPNNVAKCGLEGVNLLGLSRFALRQSKYLISELKTTTELSVKTQNEHSAWKAEELPGWVRDKREKVNVKHEDYVHWAHFR